MKLRPYFWATLTLTNAFMCLVDSARGQYGWMVINAISAGLCYWTLDSLPEPKEKQTGEKL